MYDQDVYRNLIVITDRHLSQQPLSERLAGLAALSPAGVILREKDLDEAAYEALAGEAARALGSVPLFVRRKEAADQLRIPRLHLSAGELSAAGPLSGFSELSVSCHSLEDVRRAEDAGADRIILGTIFETDCKPGLTGRGLDFLREICEKTALPVYAIGGIREEILPRLLAAGAAGGCMMSRYMRMELPL